jgi:hypothetical protein
MATTISIRVAGKALNGQGSNGTGGNNGRLGLKAKLAAGVAILGCAATLLFGGVWATQTTQPQPQPSTSATSLPAGTDDLATTGCIGTAGPFACQAGQSLSGTKDFATTGCIGTAGPFACAQGQSLAGTDDFAPIGCVQAPGPFACAATGPAVTYGTDDLATNSCVGTDGPFACAIVPLPSPANFHGEDD